MQALTCLPAQHDLRYVAVAVLVCVLGSLLSMRLLARVRRNTGARRSTCCSCLAFVAGGTVWTTHFAAMLGYNAQVARAFEPGLTFASLMITVISPGPASSSPPAQGSGRAIEGGGAIFGLGIAAMHYAGMAAFEIPGVLGWEYSACRTVRRCSRASFGAVAANRNWRGRSHASANMAARSR